jgi:hypothetical protein
MWPLHLPVRFDTRKASPDTMGVIAEVQRAVSHQSAQACADALHASYHPGTKDGKRAQARLPSWACRPASAWLDTLPLSRAHELKSGEFQASLRHRLAMLPRCNAAASHVTTGTDIILGLWV